MLYHLFKTPKKVLSLFLLTIFSLSFSVSAQYANVNLDTVKAGKFDTGRMWTFDFPPTDYFTAAYDFTPGSAWFDNVRMSALRFANYCSASFVSEDGLVMTNHHCGRESITEVTRDGEDLHRDGFWAPTLDDERKVPGLYVEQLVYIEDVTDQIRAAMDAGTTDEEKIKNRDNKKKELIANLNKEKGLKSQVVTFFNGGKYSLYGFKRYNDVRLVFAPEDQIGFFGGDPDNFTYPRYNLDVTFFRVYDDNGKPLKTDHYFKWSTNGATVGEPVFVVGNPGTTNRLYTVAMLKSQRDYEMKLQVNLLKGLVNVYTAYIAANPDKAYELNDHLFGLSNSLKASSGILSGLNNPIFMKKKEDWENKFKAAVKANPKLNKEYGDLWDKIAEGRKKFNSVFNEVVAFRVQPMIYSQYFLTASAIVGAAKKGKKPELTVFPDDFDKYKADLMLKENVEFIEGLLGANHPAYIALTGGRKGEEAYKYLLSNSKLTSKQSVENFLNQTPEEILNSDDPFIKYAIVSQESVSKLSNELKAVQTEESVYLDQLGRAVFEVYGTSIPPDATFSLRISDGVVKGYDYNGTTAPAFTTFYGLYDRFYSHEKKFPWDLPQKWVNPPADFELQVPVNFVSTNDIIGGNSGSPVINRNAEIVGLAFDGNIESLPGEFIFDETANRTVSVHSWGIYEAIKDLYKATRLANELKNHKLD
ncbi:MAG: S46 family peptidase [Ignavibacteriales bacterium]|nr:MAG: S46 family peptidase [Ignavibacteriaceae bacterium]MBW7874084.1 S46 family peptidase [Ignavibacteria bacterium]MCZ2143184.1 S46 family peptidase [Ignavibacteriales bacterium]MBV6444064.1 Dipeptidyl-peptidase 7 [Ignavibacteriaceae bacterium]MBZ0196085.1 S46 family peptidase [Ignavibacteriaceae bacterium]